MRFLFPIIALFVAIVAGQLSGPTQPAAQSPIVEYVDNTGPGFNPVAGNCQCGDFAALEKRVAALEAKFAKPQAVSTPIATNGLPPGAVIVSERVVSSQPTTQYRQMQSGQPVRNVVRGVANGTCRIVNGVRVCN
jgi:hypothetical protein